MNYSKTKKEILIVLRGDLSQKDMSLKLGYKFNQYHKWESDLKWLRWDEFIDLLLSCHIPYQNTFKLLFSYDGDPKDLKKFFSVLCAGRTMREVGAIVGHNEAIIRRWIKNDISPSVETVFKLINELTNGFFEFVNQLVDITKIPSLKLKYQELMAQKLVEIQYPFASAIEACLQLEEYKNLLAHSDKWIANRILVSESLVKKTLSLLLKAGTIIKKDNKYHINNPWISVPGLTLEQVAKVDHYWTQRCLDRYKSPNGVPYSPEGQSTNIRSFRISPVSTKCAKDIQQVLIETSKQILKIIQSDTHKKDKVAVYVSHFFDVQDIHWVKTES
jgi:transcriptional regulator with XRE-family HTH domain